VFKATFNNILAISWWLDLLVEEVGLPGENYCLKSLTNFIIYCCIEYASPWAGFELAN